MPLTQAAKIYESLRNQGRLRLGICLRFLRQQLKAGVSYGLDESGIHRVELFNFLCWLGGVTALGIGCWSAFYGKSQDVFIYFSMTASAMICQVLMRRQQIALAQMLGIFCAFSALLVKELWSGGATNYDLYLNALLCMMFTSTDFKKRWLWTAGLVMTMLINGQSQLFFSAILTMATMTWIRNGMLATQKTLSDEKKRLDHMRAERRDKIQELAVLSEQLAIQVMQDETKVDEMSEMVRILSHDLQNQLTVVKMSLELAPSVMARGGDVSKILNRIEKATEAQISIIQHIRKMRAIAEGKEAMNLTSVSLLGAFEQAEQTFASVLEKKNLRLVKLGGIDHSNIVADESSFHHQVFNNLISNAIKFSFEGSTIEVSAYQDHSVDGDYVIVTVRDHGIGIDARRAAEIFQPNRATSTKGTAGEVGTGFGMPVVKSYIERFGGSISVNSKPKEAHTGDHGTTIIMRLKSASSLKIAS
jgi:signal transduction histidine kinase